MEIVNINDFKKDNKDIINMMVLFDKQYEVGRFCRFGKVIIPSGAKIPESGLTKHDANEFSIIIKGEVDITCEGKTMHSSTGMAMCIPMNEEHKTTNNSAEDCEIIWALVK